MLSGLDASLLDLEIPGDETERQDPSPNADFSQLPEPDLDYLDFRPLDPERSLVHARMNYRGSSSAMPPLGTHVVDPAGVAVVREWIESMTEERGYPAPAP